MSFIKEFKEFAVKGNAIDMAVGIVIGAAFTTIVKSIVDDVIMPLVGMLTGGVDFSNLFINLSDKNVKTLVEAKEAGVATINYGLLINSLIAFLIVAFVLFLVVRSINKLKRKEPEVTSDSKLCPFCKTEVKAAATKCPACTSGI